MLRRRFLGGLVAALAAPAIIRTPGLLMPVSSAVSRNPWVQMPGGSLVAFDHAEGGFTTDDLTVRCYERFVSDWRDAWRGEAPGDVGAVEAMPFAQMEQSQQVLLMMRKIEAAAVARLDVIRRSTVIG